MPRTTPSPSLALTVQLGDWSQVRPGGPTGQYLERITPRAFARSIFSGDPIAVDLEGRDKLANTLNGARVWQTGGGILCAQLYPTPDTAHRIAAIIDAGHRLGVVPIFEIENCLWQIANPVSYRTVRRARLIALSITSSTIDGSSVEALIPEQITYGA